MHACHVVNEGLNHGSMSAGPCRQHPCVACPRATVMLKCLCSPFQSNPYTDEWRQLGRLQRFCHLALTHGSLVRGPHAPATAAAAAAADAQLTAGAQEEAPWQHAAGSAQPPPLSDAGLIPSLHLPMCSNPACAMHGKLGGSGQALANCLKSQVGLHGGLLHVQGMSRAFS